MIDNVTLRLYDLPATYKVCSCKTFKLNYKSDVNTYRGKMKNMGVYQNLNCLVIHGSLPKYIQGENITPLNRAGVRLGMENLEQDMGLSLKNAIVSSVEFGTSIITREKPFEYLNLFGYTKRLTRVEYSKWDGVETVNYTSETGSFEFIAYDKIKEMFDKKQAIPSLFGGSNVLRLEYKIRQKRGIEAKFKDGLSAHELFDENIYRKFQELFFDAYKSIHKMGQLVYADNSKKMTPLVLRKLLAEQCRQSYPKEYRYFIQQSKEAGKLSPKHLEQIRAENNKLGNNISVSEKSPLIAELDTLVYDGVMFGT